jgi:RHS repeat-associated protein
MLLFTDGTNSNWTVSDQFGDDMSQQTSSGTAEVRRFDLSPLAGKEINAFLLDDQTGTAAEAWGASFQQMSLVSTDGTVHSIYNDDPTYGISFSWTSGATGASAGYNTFHNRFNYESLTANYYHSDYLGSGRLMTDGSGWPVWQATFLPFGEEWNPQFTLNNRKFTGKERDAESGLDNFEARTFASNVGRFMSPDPGNAGAVASNPQSWNMYSYVVNNPTNLTDPSGMVYCRPASADESAQGSDHICDLTDSEYLDAGIFQREAYDLEGYKHFDCSCDSDADREAYANYLKSQPATDDQLFQAAVQGAQMADYALSTPQRWSTAVGAWQGRHPVFTVMAGTTLNLLFPDLSEEPEGEFINLADPEATTHILDGDANGGGHAPGVGIPNKTEFPADWSRAKIMHEVSDVATDPASKVTQQGASSVVEGTRDGVNIRVIIRNNRIVTGYPTNLPRNP